MRTWLGWLLLGCCSPILAADPPKPAAAPDRLSTWNGFERRDFTVGGRAALLVVPRTPAAGKPWIWRTEFFGHEPQADLALLAHGFHVAYLDVQNLYGGPAALDAMDRFYDHLTKERGLGSKAVLEGFSRGGLFALNWAIRHPDRVACVYNDAPVCDFKSWPGGRGKGQGSPEDWQRCLKAYSLTEGQALAYPGNPVDSLGPLAKAKVPLLHVCGDADDVVPIGENTRVVEERYKKLGGPITVIAKPGVGHHPHSLADPAPIVAFVLRHTVGASGKPATSAHVHPRGSYTNSRLRFERDKLGHVAFLGGSITEMEGYRPLVMDFLRRRFPETKFTFTNAGVASTCSTTGAFRLEEDVLRKGPVDLLFVEFAVNDDQDAGHARRECVRGMEGILRHLRAHNPRADVVMIHFVNEGMLKAVQEGGVPTSAGAHEDVARHYGVSSIDLIRELADRIKAGTMTWERYGGVHPGRPGNELCAGLVAGLLGAAWPAPRPADAKPVPHPLPDRLDPHCYERGRFLDPAAAGAGAGWTLGVPDWKAIGADCRERFCQLPILHADKPGAELTLPFTGDAVGLYVLAGPDAGTVEAAVDGGPAVTRDLYHPYSKGLHYPRTVMLATDLAPGPHTLRLRIAAGKSAASRGHAVRIVRFAAD